MRLRRDGRCLTGTKELHIVEESEFAVVTIQMEKLHPISKTTLDLGNTSRMPAEGLRWLLPHD